MFKIGDYVVHGKAGVCRVTDITEREVPGGEGSASYYVLDPVYGRFVVYSPVDNNAVYLRPVISRDDALRLIDLIPNIQAEPYVNSKQPELVQHYTEIIKSHDCKELVELTMSLYSKQRLAEESKGTFGSIDKRFIHQAEDALFGELAIALDVPKEEVQPFIANRLESGRITKPRSSRKSRRG
jgi:CarD family transcriptional regulator